MRRCVEALKEGCGCLGRHSLQTEPAPRDIPSQPKRALISEDVSSEVHGEEDPPAPMNVTDETISMEEENVDMNISEGMQQDAMAPQDRGDSLSLLSKPSAGNVLQQDELIFEEYDSYSSDEGSTDMAFRKPLQVVNAGDRIDPAEFSSNVSAADHEFTSATDGDLESEDNKSSSLSRLGSSLVAGPSFLRTPRGTKLDVKDQRLRKLPQNLAMRVSPAMEAYTAIPLDDDDDDDDDGDVEPVPFKNHLAAKPKRRPPKQQPNNRLVFRFPDPFTPLASRRSVIPHYVDVNRTRKVSRYRGIHVRRLNRYSRQKVRQDSNARRLETSSKTLQAPREEEKRAFSLTRRLFLVASVAFFALAGAATIFISPTAPLEVISGNRLPGALPDHVLHTRSTSSLEESRTPLPRAPQDRISWVFFSVGPI